MSTVDRAVDGLEQAIKDMPSVTADGESLVESIAGVAIRRPVTHTDDRGMLTEIFDPRWEFTDSPLVYVYQVTLRAGQVRGWVVHLEQTDRLFVHAGDLKIVLFDARTDSPTYGALNVIHLGANNRALLAIPPGVWHGIRNIGDSEGAFVNLPSRAYQHDDPDKYRLPLDTDVIPYRL